MVPRTLWVSLEYRRSDRKRAARRIDGMFPLGVCQKASDDRLYQFSLAILITSFICGLIATAAFASDPVWKVGRITSIRLMERSEGSSGVMPPVKEGEERGEPGGSYGTIAYLVLQSGNDTYHAQYTGSRIGELEQTRNQNVSFRLDAHFLYIKLPSGKILELRLLPSKHQTAKEQTTK